jgi:acyl dehydratase
MPVDPDKAIGFELPEVSASWDADDVILYHLGLGAGSPPVAEVELQYCYEGDLKVLPTFGVIPAQAGLAGIMSIPGLEFNPALLLHGEQDLQVMQALPTRARVVTTGRVADLYDKGKAAVVVVETETKTTDGTVLAVNRWSMFLRGEGGFGGDPGPKTANERPDRQPDHVAEFTTLPQQALIYRLSGDKNPLHVDPAVAAMAGFDRPILHGLCTFGIACRSVVDTVFGGDVSRVARYGARFSGVVFPGDTVVTSMWEDGDRILLEASTAGSGRAVLTNGVVGVRP